MGYTTYYRQKRSMTDEEFDGFCEDVKKLQEALPKTVGAFVSRFGRTAGSSEGDESTPLAIEPQASGSDDSVIGAGRVGFNGAGFEDADHETFLVPKNIEDGAESWEADDIKAGKRFHFTKTARKPYDVMVCACLLALKKRASSAWQISSDGDVEDWASSYRFAKGALGLKSLPLEKIGSFGENLAALGQAKEPTAWMLAEQERAALEKQVKAKPPAKRSPGL
jgi:hypothetical protein